MSAHKYLLLAAILLIPACQAFTPAKFSPTGVPLDNRYIVGGGFMGVEYTAPSAGTAVWVNRANNRPIVTKSLKIGETYNFSLPSIDEEKFKQLFGDIDKINIVLYFIPAESAPTAQPTPQ